MKILNNDLVKRMILNKNKYPYKYQYNWEVRIINTELDPKHYSPTEMEGILYAKTN